MALGLLPLLVTNGAFAQVRSHVAAKVAADRRKLAFTQTLEVGRRQLVGGKSLRLWLYGDKLRAKPVGYDEFTADRFFPGAPNAGGFGALKVRVEGCKEAVVVPAVRQASATFGRIVDIPICKTAPRPVKLTISGRFQIAFRNGTLGASDDDTSLGDPWYPIPLAPYANQPLEGRHSLDVSTPKRRLLVTDGKAHWGKHIKQTRPNVTHLPMFLLDKGTVRRERIAGIDLLYVMRRAPLPKGGGERDDPLKGGDPFDPDAARRMQASAQHAVRLLRRLGFTRQGRGRAMRSALTLVEMSERRRLAVALPGVVAVSDRAFRLLPSDKVARFHGTSLQRQVYRLLIEPHIRRTHRKDQWRWAAELDASLLTDLWLKSRNSGRQSAKDLVGFAGFHPAVDQLLYAPQVAFKSAYFNVIDERDEERDGVWRALRPSPSGHLIYEKLKDLLGRERFFEATKAHFFHRQGWPEASSKAFGEPMGWFFSQWLTRRRHVAYQLGEVHSTAVQGGYEHRVDLRRLGEVNVREPVVVEAIDKLGNKARARWDASGAKGQVSIITKGPLYNLRLDPDHRLVQDPRYSDNHPRFDDELKHVWRPPVFNSFHAGASVGEGQPQAVADFSLKRRYDIREAFGFLASSSFRGTTGRLRYRRGLGKKRDLNNASQSWTSSISGFHSNSNFGGATQEVWGGNLTTGYGINTRTNVFNPRQGFGIGVSGSVGFLQPTDGSTQLTLRLSTRGQTIFWPQIHHVLVLTYGASVVRCPTLPQFLPALAGQQGFRGYELDELLGCGGAYVMLEDRWTILKGLFTNIADFVWGRKLNLVPFAGVGMLSTRSSALEFDRAPIVDAGLGVHAHFDYFGVQPGVMAVDLGFPVSRREQDRCARKLSDGSCGRFRQPFGLYVSFEQIF